MGRALACAIALFFALTMTARPTQAEAFDPRGHDWEGYSDLADLARSELGEAFSTVSRVDYDKLRKDDTLVLVHPEGHLDVDNLTAFLRSGGRLILLDDFGSGERLLRRYGILRVDPPSRPRRSLRHNPAFAIAEPHDPQTTLDVLRGVTQLVTNHPSALSASPLTPLLDIRGEDGQSVAVAAMGSVSEGRLIVLSDPSALMNAMLRYAGNQALARNLVEFCRRGSGKIYLAVGAFDERGAFDDASDLEPLKRAARGAVAYMSPFSRLEPKTAHVLAALLGLGLVIWIGSRAGRTYRVARPRLSRPVPLSLQGGVAGRAAAIGSPHTPRDRALLELGKALEDELSLVLGGPARDERPVSHEWLLATLEKRGLLGQESLRALRELLAKVAHLDTLMLAGRFEALPKVKDAEVLEARQIMLSTLSKVRANLAGRAAA